MGKAVLCECGKEPGLSSRTRKGKPRYEVSCPCGSNAYAATAEKAIAMWNDMMTTHEVDDG